MGLSAVPSNEYEESERLSLLQCVVCIRLYQF